MPKNGVTHTGIIQLRMPGETITKLNNSVKPTGKYESVSDAIRKLIDKGFQLDAFMDIMNDPKKKKEFEHNLKFMFNDAMTQQTIEAMPDDQLDTLAMYVSVAKNKRTQQLVLSLR